MATYFITYDFRNGRDYEGLYKKLENFNAIKVLKSNWYFNRYKTSTAQLRDYFNNFIDSDDGFIISKINNWASYNTDNSPNDL